VRDSAIQTRNKLESVSVKQTGDEMKGTVKERKEWRERERERERERKGKNE